MKNKYGGAIVSHNSNGHTADDEDGFDDMIDGAGGPVTRDNSNKRRMVDDGDNLRLLYKKVSTWNTYLLSAWSHPETVREYIDAFILLPSGIANNNSYK